MSHRTPPPPAPATAAVLALALALAAPPAAAQSVPCGGDFAAFVAGLRAEALAAGLPEAAVAAFFRGVRQDAAVLSRDRAQGIFRRDFIDFSRALISQDRLRRGAAMAERHAALLARAGREHGVPRGILLAFWAFETDYGAGQGDFSTRDALVTLAHDCRRPGLFRPHVLAAIALAARGDIDPATTRGAWAGEIGHIQMLPADLLAFGTDADGDGRVDVRGSVADAILTAAAKLAGRGWRAGEPWMVEVAVPQALDWRLTGLETALAVDEWAARGVRARHGALPDGGLAASVLLPQGRLGPAFLVFPNFRVLFAWNQSFVYVTTTGYFATRLEGAPVYAAGNPEPGLSGEQMMALQRRLAALGHDVGAIDGILGARTRAAVQAEQARLGLPADAWPTPALLARLGGG
ncbi:MAG: lytic murein transglycosylase [Rhodobacteraceae bacterium]|jgi:lytic murein transglycosylase|nr:lytic murein transglycosylase [Paracoccaceae bacterium]